MSANPEQDIRLQFRDELATSGNQYREDFIKMPQAMLEKSLQFMSKMTGIHGKVTMGRLKSEAQWKPYTFSGYDPKNTTVISPRSVETYECELLEVFNPESVFRTVYGKKLTKDRINQKAVRECVAEMARSCSSKLTKALWTGKLNAAGSTTMDCFDGFDTIVEKEKAAGAISKALGNYFQSGKLTPYNIGDKLLLIWTVMPFLFKDAHEKIFVYLPPELREMYDKWYNDNYKGANYTNEFNQQYLVGTNNKCVIASMGGMEDVKHIIFTTANNMIVAFDGESGQESFECRVPENPKLVQVFGTIWMGCQIMNLEKECFYCSSFTSEQDIPYIDYDKEEVTFDDTVANATSTATVHISGHALTSTLSVSVTGTGFSTTTSTITAANANAAAGVDITVTFAPTAAGDYTGKLVISSATDIVDVEIPLKGNGTAAPEEG